MLFLQGNIKHLLSALCIQKIEFAAYFGCTAKSAQFEASCVEFHKTKRTVRTPSAAQVRQPINTSGVDQWRNFEEHLDPLKQALGPDLLDAYGIDPPR